MVYFRLLERIMDDERICQAVVLLKKQKGFQYDVDPIGRMMDRIKHLLIPKCYYKETQFWRADK